MKSFQPEEGPSRGLVSDCETLNFTKVSLLRVAEAPLLLHGADEGAGGTLDLYLLEAAGERQAAVTAAQRSVQPDHLLALELETNLRDDSTITKKAPDSY